MFEHYQNEVLSVCKNKLATNQLPHLNEISPALLRQECLNIFKERYNPQKDDVALRLFFGPDEKNRGYLKVIDEHPTNKFRTLSIFFKKQKRKPDQKNLELLAWLIDFEKRPYQSKSGYDISMPIDEKEEIITENIQIPVIENNEVEIENIPEKHPEITPAGSETDNIKEGSNQETGIQHIQTIFTTNRPLKEHHIFGFPKKFHKTIYAFAATAIVLFVSYIFFRGPKQCMYWNGEQYISIACDERLDNASVVAFDDDKAGNLKRILRPDTLTENSVRKVWYNKVWADSVDFYTAPGDVPANRNKRLMPMTNYILNKYVIQKRSQ